MTRYSPDNFDVFLLTDDCQKSYEELAACGVEFTETPEDPPYATSAEPQQLPNQ